MSCSILHVCRRPSRPCIAPALLLQPRCPAVRVVPRLLKVAERPLLLPQRHGGVRRHDPRSGKHPLNDALGCCPGGLLLPDIRSLHAHAR